MLRSIYNIIENVDLKFVTCVLQSSNSISPVFVCKNKYNDKKIDVISVQRGDKILTEYRSMYRFTRLRRNTN